MEFDPQTESNEHSETEQHILFDAHGGLEGIFSQLLHLKEAAINVQGTEKSYSAPELADRVMGVLRAADEEVRKHDTNLAQNLSRWVDEGRSEAPSIDVHSLPELQTLTRSGGLREAVAQALQAMIDSPRRVGHNTVLWISGEVTELYHRCRES